MRFLIAAATIAGLIAPAFARDSTETALNLGSVLASEEYCGLSYNQDAIAAFIEKNVPADDMSFSSTLQMMTRGAALQMETLSVSEKTAHCSQINRVSKSYGFTE